MWSQVHTTDGSIEEIGHCELRLRTFGDELSEFDRFLIKTIKTIKSHLIQTNT